ncbi:MAG TPA: response regulator [Polyangiaceae bacterium]|nr:response regulator [Polyangiaceae bacterium]
MRVFECSQCGVSADGHVWGFALLVTQGWGLADSTNPPGAAERAWLCEPCCTRKEHLSRGLGKLSAAKPAREREGQRLKVLIVDDHLLMLRSLVRMLAGCETMITTSPREAWAVLQSSRFDAIVSDVMMPEMSGPELYARCHAYLPELARRFIFASADPILAQREIEQTARRLGVTQAPPLLPKPASRTVLMSAVASVARGAVHESGTYTLRLADDAASDQVK